MAKTKQDNFLFNLPGDKDSDKFFFECNSEYEQLVTALYAVAKDDLFVREALKVVGDFINDEFYKEE